MIRITSVEIDGFIIPSQKVKLDFVESNIVCIYGNNGSGKTTFLEILFAVFDKNEKILEKYNVNSINIFYSNYDTEIKNEILTDIESEINRKNIEEEKLKKLKLSEKVNSKKLLSQHNKSKLQINDKFDKSEKKLKNDLKDKKNQLLKELADNEKYKLIEKDFKNKINSLEEQRVEELKLLEKQFNGVSPEYEQKKISLESLIRDIENEIQKKQNDLKQITQIYSAPISKREKPINNENYSWDKFNSSKFSNISSIFLGIGRGIHKKENNFPRRMLWSFFNINRDIEEGRLSSKDIDEFTDRLVDYLKNEDKTNEGKEYFDIKEKDKQKNIYLPNIEIDTIEQLLVNKFRESVMQSDKKITQALSSTTMSFFNKGLPDKVNIDIETLKDNLIKNRSLILEVFNFNKNYKSYFTDKIVSILNSLEINKNCLNKISDLDKTILFNTIEVLENENRLFRQIEIFIKEYNTFLNCEKKLFIDSSGVKIKPSNHSLLKLSSGERHLLTFLSTILLLGEKKKFILLDEPEISLDIEWQEKLLSTIAKLAPDAQIIVASHTPSIMGDYFDESVEITLCEE